MYNGWKKLKTKLAYLKKITCRSDRSMIGCWWYIKMKKFSKRNKFKFMHWNSGKFIHYLIHNSRLQKNNRNWRRHRPESTSCFFYLEVLHNIGVSFMYNSMGNILVFRFGKYKRILKLYEMSISLINSLQFFVTFPYDHISPASRIIKITNN